MIYYRSFVTTLSWVTVTIIALIELITPSTAMAIPFPKVNPNTLPVDSPPTPPIPMREIRSCHTFLQHQSTLQPNFDNQNLLNLKQAWKFSKGSGQTIAILDTGVDPQPLLPHLIDGGDYVASDSGLSDCDGHGTLIAGIIGAQASTNGFVGVAPLAHLISIRINSNAWSPNYLSDSNSSADNIDTLHSSDSMVRNAAIIVSNLAKAIVHAANMGATVILIPNAYCIPIEKNVKQDTLGAAIHYATVTKNSVIIAAAGNNGSTNSNLECKNNPPVNPENSIDIRNWSAVETLSIPSLWQPYVLSVASVTTNGTISHFTMSGPWVSISAPGEHISSLSNTPNTGTLISYIIDNRGKRLPIIGTDYAAAYAAGVVALVRSKYPQLTWHQIINRIVQTAQRSEQAPSNFTGVGMIDPTAALTWNLTPGEQSPAFLPVLPIDLPTPPPAHSSLPIVIALIGSTTAFAIVLLISVLMSLRRKHPYEK